MPKNVLHRELENIVEETSSKNATIRLENGIVMVDIVPGVEEVLSDAEDNLTALARICKGEKKPVYINPGPHKSMSRDARVYYVKESPRYAVAIAVLARSPFSRLLSTFLLGLNRAINKGSLPLKFVTSKEEGIIWLKQFMDN